MSYNSKYEGSEVDNLLTLAGTSVQAIKMNGVLKKIENGVVDLGDIVTKRETWKTVSTGTTQILTAIKD